MTAWQTYDELAADVKGKDFDVQSYIATGVAKVKSRHKTFMLRKSSRFYGPPEYESYLKS